MQLRQMSCGYHFGPKVANKYKKRILVDNDYRIALATAKLRGDSINEANKVADKMRRDSLEKVNYEKRFEQQRMENEKRYMEDSLKAVRTAGEQGGQTLKVDSKLEQKTVKTADSIVSINMLKLVKEPMINWRKQMAMVRLQGNSLYKGVTLVTFSDLLLPKQQRYGKGTKYA